MRKLTNSLSLPKAIVHAVENDSYDPGGADYTITGLLKPAKAFQIEKTTELTEDISKCLYLLHGQVMHSLLERAGKDLKEEGLIVEQRFTAYFDLGEKSFSVSSQVDIFDPETSTVSDYKETSVSAAKYGLKEEHYFQVNFQALVLRKAGFTVTSGEVVLLLRDWSPMRSYEGYPTSPIMKFTIPLMEEEELIKWVKERIKAHEEAKTALPQCTDEERWSRPTFAVMKNATAARATRVFDTKQEAEDYIATTNPTLLLVERKGISIRCMHYCPARTVCEQAKALRMEEEEPKTTKQPIDKDGFSDVS